MTPYVPTAIRRPFAGVFHQPPSNPPLGAYESDRALGWTQADREDYARTGGKDVFVDDEVEHDAAVEQLISALAGERARTGPDPDAAGGEGR